MIKKIICTILTVLLMLNMFISAAYAAEANIDVEFTDKGLFIWGNSGVRYDNISIMLLRPGVTDEQIKTVGDGGGIFTLSHYINVVKADSLGDFQAEVETTLESGKVYTLLVSGQGIEKSIKLSGGSLYEEKDNLVSLIRFYDEKITVIGTGVESNSKLELYIYDVNSVIYDVEDSLNPFVIYTDENKKYEIDIPVDYSEINKYRLYVREAGSDEIYENNIHYITKPATVYVGQDNEFKTIDEAKNYLRTNLRDVPVNVIVADGIYRQNQSISFTSADKREADNPVTYIAQNRGKAVLSGGKVINAELFEEISETDEAYERFPENVRGKIIKVNLAQLGIDESLYDFKSYYNQLSDDTAVNFVKTLNVFLNDESQGISSYPDENFATDAEAVFNDEGAYVDRMQINASLAQKWSASEDMIVSGYFAYSWQMDSFLVDEIDTSNAILKFSHNSVSGIQPQRETPIRWKVLNLPEEITIPGEWYINPDTGDLYYYPPYELTEKDTFEIAVLDDDIIKMNETEYVFFDGLTLCKNASKKTYGYHEPAKNNGFDLLITNSNYFATSNACANIIIDNCLLKDIGDNGVCVYAGKSRNVIVENSRIYNTGGNGVYLSAGTPSDMIRSDCVIRNCDISNVGLTQKGISGICVVVGGVGVIVENNLLHNAAGSGLRYYGPDHIIRRNEVFSVDLEHGDAGAIYGGGSWTAYGTEITENLIHTFGADEYFGEATMGIYLDDYMGGGIVTRNIIINNNENIVARMVHVGHGPDVTAESNIFIKETTGSRTTRGVAMMHYPVSGISKVAETLETASESYLEAYPKAAARKGLYLGIPAIGEVTEEQKEILKTYKEDYVVRNNLALNMEPFYHPEATDNGWGKRDWNQIKTNHVMTGVQENNVRVEDTSIFVNPNAMDYRIKSSATGIPENVLMENDIDINEIGLLEELPMEKEFKLISPVNNTASLDENTTFVWESLGNFDSYKYEVSRDIDFENIVLSGTTANTHKTVSLQDGQYFWRVTAQTASKSNVPVTTEVFTFIKGNSSGTIFAEPELLNTDKEKVEDGTDYSNQKIMVKDTLFSLKDKQSAVYILIAQTDKDEYVYKIINHTFNSAGDVNLWFDTLPADKKFVKYRLLRWSGFDKLKPITAYTIYI